MENTVPEIVTSVFNVFSGIGTWFSTTIPTLLELFWNSESGLTIIGTLALCGLGIGVILKVFHLIRGFFSFGG